MILDYKKTFTSPYGVPFNHMKVVRGEDGKMATVVSLDKEGKTVKVPQTEEAPLTLGDAILTACQNRLEDDKDLSAIDVVNIGTAGIAVMRDQPLSTDQVSMLKGRICKFFDGNPLLVALIHEALESSGDAPKKPKK
jgi:hypothetical protein